MIDKYLNIFFNYTIIPSILIFLSVYRWWAMDNYPCIGFVKHKFGKWEIKDDYKYQVRICENCGFCSRRNITSN